MRATRARPSAAWMILLLASGSAAAPPPRLASFRRFSDQLYCSAVAERQCVLPGSAVRQQPGECLWFDPSNKVLTFDEMFTKRDRGRWAADHWDASAVVGPSMRVFSRAAAAACVAGRHVLITGESTTRDLFYEFATLAGLAPSRAPCMNYGKGNVCTRVVSSADNATRISFQFLSKVKPYR